MNKIYDNGEYVLGTAKNLLKYYNEFLNEFPCDSEDSEIIDLIDDIKDYEDDNTILCINYACGMGSYIVASFDDKDYFKEMI